MKARSIDVETEVVRTALLAIAARNNGVLNPHQVLDAARSTDHVLHRHFEWDDSLAADEYRLAQAGALIRRVRLTIVKSDKDAQAITLTTTRGYQSRPSMRGSEGGYETVDAILANEEKRAELLAQVLRELSAYRKRYAELVELQAIWAAVDEAASELSSTEDSSSIRGDDEPRPGTAV